MVYKFRLNTIKLYLCLSICTKHAMGVKAKGEGVKAKGDGGQGLHTN